MNNIYELTRRLESCQYNKNKLQYLASKLKESIEQLEYVYENEKSGYQVDDNPSCGGYISDLYEKEKSLYNNIQNYAIPSLINRISNLKSDISLAKQQAMSDN